MVAKQAMECTVGLEGEAKGSTFLSHRSIK